MMRSLLRLLAVLWLVVPFAAGAQQTPAGIEVGYMPIVSDAQAFVILEGQTKDNPLKGTKLIEFQDGPGIVQALLGGQLDVAYVGIGPTMVARAKGADIRAVAADGVASNNLLALPDLVPYFKNGSAETAFARFAQDKGRKAVITTFPRGSVPGAVLQHWLTKVLKLDPGVVKVIYQGAAQAQQSLLTGAVDAGIVPEPTRSIVQARVPGAEVVADAQAMFANHPAAVLVVREKLIQEHPDYVQRLVAAQIEATALLRDHADQAAPAVQKYVGGGRLPLDVVLQSLKNSHDSFTADPHRSMEGTQALYDFQRGRGTLARELNVPQLFDTQFYDGLQ